MRRAVRVSLVVLGAAMAVYGTASLTGGWLGTPPWWECRRPSTAADEESAWCEVWHCTPQQAKRIRSQRTSPPTVRLDSANPGIAGSGYPREGWSFLEPDESVQFATALQSIRRVRGLRAGREWISGGVVVAGLALVAVGAWPRRRRPPAPT